MSVAIRPGICKGALVVRLETVGLDQNSRMDLQQAELRERIQQFSFDALDANVPFSHRLARDNGWTLDYTQRVIEE